VRSGVAALPGDDQVRAQRGDAFEVDPRVAADARDLAAAGGYSLYSTVPTMRSPAPAANSVSVRCGARLTMRFAGCARRSVAPLSSTTLTSA
jgi:hypothetical protein